MSKNTNVQPLIDGYESGGTKTVPPDAAKFGKGVSATCYRRRLRASKCGARDKHRNRLIAMFDYDPRLSAHLKSLQPVRTKHQPTKKAENMFTGVIRRFDQVRGYGFIHVDADVPGVKNNDVFFHIRNQKGIAQPDMQAGVRVSFKTMPSKLAGKPDEAQIVAILLWGSEAT